MVTQQVTIMRGLPGSGKSTYAKALVDAGKGRVKRISRDDFRLMLDNGTFENVDENLVTVLRDHAIVAALNAGYDIVIDETNVVQKRIDQLVRVCERSGADFDYTVEVIDTPIEECLRRNALRTGPACVPEHAIRRMDQQWKEDDERLARGRRVPRP